MDLSEYTMSRTAVIAAPPEKVWDVVADITGMGALSPVCTGGEWDEPIGPCAGAWFTGHNRTEQREWSTRCLVEAADRGKLFFFVSHGPQGAAPLVRWSYEMAPADDGTEVTERWQVLDSFADYMATLAPTMDINAYLDGVRPNTASGIEQTLDALKRVVEG